MGFQHSLRIQPEREQIKSLRQWLDSFKNNYPSIEQVLEQFKIVMSEWITNIIIHSKTQATGIFIHIKQTLDVVELTISEDSSPFIDHLIHKNKLLQMIHDESPVLQDKGMGLFIITKLFQNWIYNPKSNIKNYNEFIIRIPLVALNIKPSIALIDTTENSEESLIKILEENYTVIGFKNYESFLKETDLEKYELVVCNSENASEGIKIKDQLNQVPHYAVIPFILINSDENNKLEEQANQLGIDDFLRKPFKKNVVKRVIARAHLRHTAMKQKYIDLFAKDINATHHMKLPATMNGYTVVVDHRPAGIGGGDFVLHHQEGNQHLILLSDVMGHGISAKYFEYSFIGYIKGLMYSLGLKRGPAFFLENLSHILQQDEALYSVIMTCIALVIHDNGSIEIANAAHPFPLLIDQQGLKTIEIAGRLLAISDNSTYQSSVVYLEKNQQLVLYTDGLFEQGHDFQSRQQNDSKLKNVLTMNHSLPVEKSLQNLMVKFDEQTFLKPRDDMTVIFIEKTRDV